MKVDITPRFGSCLRSSTGTQRAEASDSVGTGHSAIADDALVTARPSSGRRMRSFGQMSTVTMQMAACSPDRLGSPGVRTAASCVLRKAPLIPSAAMPQSDPTIVAVMFACPLCLTMHSARLTVTMMTEGCLDCLTEMSQVCEQHDNITTTSREAGTQAAGAIPLLVRGLRTRAIIRKTLELGCSTHRISSLSRLTAYCPVHQVIDDRGFLYHACISIARDLHGM
jgi:hypothetical protein